MGASRNHPFYATDGRYDIFLCHNGWFDKDAISREISLTDPENYVASAVIMGEIALSFPDPLKALTVVAMAASCTFITPFGNQSNLLVKSPGGYTTKDYAIYGSIVVVLVFLITMIYAL